MWHPHSCCVNFGKVGKQSINLALHIVVWGNGVQEILNDAKVKVNSKRVGGQSYPVAGYMVGKHRTYSVLLVPYTCVVTIGITG